MAMNTRRSLLVDGTQGSQLKYGGGNLPGRDQQHEVSGPPQAVYSRLSSQDLLEGLTPDWQRHLVPRHDPGQDPPSLLVAVGSLHHLIGELIQSLHVHGVGKLAVVEYDLVDELLSLRKMIKTLYPTKGQGLINVSLYPTTGQGLKWIIFTTNSWGHSHLASHEAGVHPEDSGSLFLLRNGSLLATPPRDNVSPWGLVARQSPP